MANLASSEYPDILEDFLDISRRRRNNRTALAKLQIHMLEEIIFQEAAVKHYRAKLRELEEDKSPGVDDAARREERDFCKRELFFYRVYANAIRGIGDGIAWRSLGYDRAVVRLMSERATKQTIVSEGTVQELREWSVHFDSGTGLAILNALTNCLAIGDITVVRDDGSVEIVEVKSSSAKSGRKVRQKQKMKEVVTLLSTGSGQADDKEVTLQTLPITPETGLPILRDLLQAASKSGWSSRKVSNCLYLEAFDFRELKTFEEIRQDLERAKMEAIAEWEERGDFVLDMNSMENLAFGPNCAPFSIFPFDSRTCIELLIGSKCYVSHLNIDAVAREFQFRGWNIEKTSEDLFREGNKDAVLTISKGGFHANVPPADLMRLQLETVRAKTIIESYDVMYKQGPTGEEGFQLSLYAGESEIWD
jgi:hypothetical protein